MPDEQRSVTIESGVVSASCDDDVELAIRILPTMQYLPPELLELQDAVIAQRERQGQLYGPRPLEGPDFNLEDTLNALLETEDGDDDDDARQRERLHSGCSRAHLRRC